MPRHLARQWQATMANHFKGISRIVGILLLIQITGLIVPFIMLHPLMTGTEGYLANAAGAADQIKNATLLLLLNCMVGIGVSVAAWRVVSPHSTAMATLAVALSVLMLCLQAIDNAHIMALVSLSQEYHRLGGASDLQSLAVVAGTSRKWVHYTELLTIDAWIFLLHFTLYRFALVPRPLAAFGALTVVLHFGAIVLPAFLGYGGFMPLGAAMALGHVLLAGWLLVRGFREGEPSSLGLADPPLAAVPAG